MTDTPETLASLRAERDKAREECGVLRYRLERSEAEMYIQLRSSMAYQKELAELKAITTEPQAVPL